MGSWKRNEGMDEVSRVQLTVNAQVVEQVARRKAAGKIWSREPKRNLMSEK